MAGVGTNIAAVDYNAIRSAINPILDKVSTGYGQTPSSNTVSTAGIVTAAQWQALYADIAAVNFHLLNDVPKYSSNYPTVQPTPITYPGPVNNALTSGSVVQTVASSNVVVVSSNSGLVALQPFVIFGTGGGGLSAGTYYVINPAVATNQITLASTYANAVLGTAVTLSNAVIGGTTFTAQTPIVTGTITGTSAPNLVTLSSGAGVVAQEPFVVTGNSNSTGGLSAGVYYVVNPAAGVNQVTLATSLANAIAGTAINTFTTASITSTSFVAGQQDIIKEADRAAYLAVAQALANTTSQTIGGITYPGCYYYPALQQSSTTSASPLTSTRTAAWGGTTVVNNEVGISYYTSGTMLAAKSTASTGNVTNTIATSNVAVVSKNAGLAPLAPFVISGTGGGGLSAGTYYIISVSGTQVILASSIANAKAGTPVTLSTATLTGTTFSSNGSALTSNPGIGTNMSIVGGGASAGTVVTAVNSITFLGTIAGSILTVTNALGNTLAVGMWIVADTSSAAGVNTQYPGAFIISGGGTSWQLDTTLTFTGINGAAQQFFATNYTINNSQTIGAPGSLATGIASYDQAESNVQTVNHTFTVTFPTASAAIYYFNAGGIVNISGALSPDAGTNTKIHSWVGLLSGMGTIKFGRSTIATGSGTPGIGFTGLTTSYQTVFTNSLSGTLYAPNQYLLQAKIDATNTIITFNAQFQDLSTATTENTFKATSNVYDIDEDVTGTLTHSVSLTYASGSYVSTTAYNPTLATTASL